MPARFPPGTRILIYDEEWLIAEDMAETCAEVGAQAVASRDVAEALDLIEHREISGAIVDCGGGTGSGEAICGRLRAQSIPYVNYGGAESSHDATVHKPTPPHLVAQRLIQLLRPH